MPSLERVSAGPVRYWTDHSLLGELGILVAFTERAGGVSEPPFASLNLASHVGDAADAVDENRSLLLDSLGIGGLRERLTLAEQVHGERIALIAEDEAGSGARAANPERVAVPECDAMVTGSANLPLLMCFADCVPVILVSRNRRVAVVHAGWRGALAGLPGSCARELARFAGCDTGEITAYIGAHIGACCYPVGAEVERAFAERFESACNPGAGLNLSSAVRESLVASGVPDAHVTDLAQCTAENTDRFYSYRAEGGTTGRHGALACILAR